MRINIFKLILLISLSICTKVLADTTKVELYNTNDLKCMYNVELDNNILNSKIDCRYFENTKDFIKGWDKNNCKFKNYTFEKESSTYQKIAIYCLSLDEKKYIQVY